jgi:hypothetical protein
MAATDGTGDGSAMAARRAKRRANGIGTAAMFNGIMALLMFWNWPVVLIFSGTAIIAGIVGRQRVKRGEATNMRMATSAVVLGALAVAAAGVLLAFGIASKGIPTSGVVLMVVNVAVLGAMVAFGIAIIKSESAKSRQTRVGETNGQAERHQRDEQFKRDQSGVDRV